MNHAVTFLVATIAVISIAALVVGFLFYRIRNRKPFSYGELR